MQAEIETFWTLLHDSAHWEFEVFLMVVFDGLIGYLGFRVLWPRIKAHFHEDLEHAGHGHEPDAQHGAAYDEERLRLEDLQKAVDVAIWHLDEENDGETALNVLLGTKGGR